MLWAETRAETGVEMGVGKLKVDVLLWLLLLAWIFPIDDAWAAIGDAAPASEKVPRYKPSSRSPEPLDIRTNSYGATRTAPDALGIGQQAQAFRLPKSGGGKFEFSAGGGDSDLVIVFYRGHW